MRRTVLTVLALTASTSSSAQPAQAMRPFDGHRAADRAAKIDCATSVLGVDSKGHVTYDLVQNDKVKKSSRSNKKLDFDVSAWGFYDSAKRTIRFDAVSDSGTPRRVSATLSAKGKIEVAGSTKYAQNTFKPRLFADSDGFYAYTVDNQGKLARWALTRYANGKVKFAQKVGLGSGFDSFTSLSPRRPSRSRARTGRSSARRRRRGTGPADRPDQGARRPEAADVAERVAPGRRCRGRAATTRSTSTP